MARRDRSNLTFSPGDNCWKAATAERYGWLIDGEDYFRALRDSFDAAEHEIIIVGWDIDSRTQLIRDEDDPRYPSPLCDTLEKLVEDKPELNVYILSWDFAAVYMLERELLPALSFDWTTGERMQFKLDGNHAHGASHHQKIVIVDGAVAFVGGFDITKCRWDTRQHEADDARRVDTDGNAYRPFHDVQAVVSGDVVTALRELANTRWQKAGCDAFANLPSDIDSDPWPTNTPVRAEGAEVAIARTFVDTDGGERTLEVERLFLDMIHSARDSIYIENQYFTSSSIVEALGERMVSDDGPEIVVVLPGVTSGWLEQATMDLLRNRAIDALRDADKHHRMRIVAPSNESLSDSSMNVHAKIMVVDQRWARIGSANLSRRSMGLDSECDLIVDAADGDAALMLCADLLGEHLGADCADVAERLRNDGLFASIDAFNEGPRCLRPLEVEEGAYDSWLEPLADIADMERPIENPLAAGFTDNEARGSSDADGDGEDSSVQTPVGGWVFMVVIAAVIGFWVYWVAKSGENGFDLSQVLASAREFAGHPLAPLGVIAAIVAGSLVVAPITGMIAICGLIFSPWLATATALTGTILATIVNHWIGRRFGNILTNRVPDRVSARIARLGEASDILSLAALRLIPIAPFTVINLIVGAAGVGLRPFLTGTLIGMGPGTLLICLSVDRARAALAGEAVFDPWIIGAIAVAAIAFIALRIWLKRDTVTE